MALNIKMDLSGVRVVPSANAWTESLHAKHFLAPIAQ